MQQVKIAITLDDIPRIENGIGVIDMSVDQLITALRELGVKNLTFEIKRNEINDTDNSPVSL